MKGEGKGKFKAKGGRERSCHTRERSPFCLSSMRDATSVDTWGGTKWYSTRNSRTNRWTLHSRSVSTVGASTMLKGKKSQRRLVNSKLLRRSVSRRCARRKRYGSCILPC
ncbi:hypothetical protein PC123_g21262 [Phytophthora cactorum]|nr:hypothetical protein PC123_g21262 [Phytophthora cactorum]